MSLSLFSSRVSFAKANYTCFGLFLLAFHTRFCKFIAFVTHLNLVDVEDDVLVGKHNPLSFDAAILRTADTVSSNCSLTGETMQFDVIKREGYDEILETAANQYFQSEAVARSLRDTIDHLSTKSLSR
jgi:hypothetical protein